MLKRSAPLVAAIIAALTLTFATSTASANRLSVDDQDFVVTYNDLWYVGWGQTIECEVTLTGSFAASTFEKVSQMRVGHITSASVNSPNCTGGSWTFLNESLPWDILYTSFQGSLPTISGIEMAFIGYSFAITLSGFGTCLARTTTTEPVGEIFALDETGAVTALDTDAEYAIDASDTSGTNCDLFGINITFAGTGLVEDGSANPLAFSLI